MRFSILIGLFLVSLSCLHVSVHARDDTLYVMPPVMDSVCDSCATNSSLCHNSLNVSYSYCGAGSLQTQTMSRTGNQCCLNMDHLSAGDAYVCSGQSGNLTAETGEWFVVDHYACVDVSKGKGHWLWDLAIWAIILFFVAVIGAPLCIILCCCYWCCCRRRRSYGSGYVAQNDGSAYHAW